MPDDNESERLKAAGYTLHQRVIDGDVTASAEIAELFFPAVIEKLRRRYANLHDPHLVDAATADAFVSYLERPSQYDPTKLDLASYLLMSANGDLRNTMRKEFHEADHQSLNKSVELGGGTSEHEIEIQDDFNLEETVFAQLSPLLQQIPALLPNPVDQKIALLILDGERRTEVYAEILEIAGVQSSEQARIVKRHKDRIKKTLLRNIDRSEVDDYA